MPAKEPEDTPTISPEKAYLMLPNDIIDADTAALIALALGVDSAEYERAFDHPQALTHNTGHGALHPNCHASRKTDKNYQENKKFGTRFPVARKFWSAVLCAIKIY